MRLFPRPTWLTRRTPLSRLLGTTTPSAVHHTSAASPACIDIPKLLVKPGSPKHNSLSSYIEYAKDVNLRTDRTVYVGTHYEYTAAEALLRLGFSLIRTGKMGDAGIDLIGHWMLSIFREPMPVIVQCKAKDNTCSPVEIRSLEGAFHSVPQEWRNKDVLALLISPGKSTEGLRKQMHLSTRPVAFLRISRDGVVTQFLWNRAAAEKGLEGVGVTPRYTVLPSGLNELAIDDEIPAHQCRLRDANGRFMPGPAQRRETRAVVTDVQLTWLGTPIFPNKEELVLETARQIAQISQSQEEKPKGKLGRPLGSKNNTKNPSDRTRKRLEKTPRLDTSCEVLVAPKTSVQLPELQDDSDLIITAPKSPKKSSASKPEYPSTPRRTVGRPRGSTKFPFDTKEQGEIKVVTPPEKNKKRGRPRKIAMPDGG